MVILLMLVVFATACLPAAPAQPQQAQSTPTLDNKSQINTAVAQTIQAQNEIATAVALTTQAQYTATPSPTLFSIPTLTPFVILTPTKKPSGGGGASSKPAYACDIIRVRPRAYAKFNRGQEFDIKLTVVNQGTRAWNQGYDLKYAGGSKMTTVTRFELPAMAPGAKREVIFDANAPMERGTHTMTWTIEGRLCFGYVTIVVK